VQEKQKFTTVHGGSLGDGQLTPYKDHKLPVSMMQRNRKVKYVTK